jgi:hypothetical protein
MRRQILPLWFEHHNNILWKAQIMKLIITDYFPSPCYFLKYKIKKVTIKIIRQI